MLEFVTESVDEDSTRTTARVITDIDADILCVVEAENRPSLARFNRDRCGNLYQHVMLIDGNDTRGIDVGIMTKDTVEIINMRSNVDLLDGTTGEPLFSRGCAMYQCRIGGDGPEVWVLLNHFKSQSGGGGDKRQ